MGKQPVLSCWPGLRGFRERSQRGTGCPFLPLLPVACPYAGAGRSGSSSRSCCAARLGCWGRGAEQEKSKEIWNFTLAPASNTAKLLVECSGSVFKHRVCQLREKTFRGFIKCFILC